MNEPRDPPIDEEPPDPPELPRRVHLYRNQWIGVPVLFLLPALAVIGLFGERRVEVRLDQEELAIRVEYPVRLRAGQRSELVVHLHNRGSTTVRDVMVQWDADFLRNFTEVDAAAGEHEPGPGLAIAPGADRAFRIELEGNELWSRRGRITVVVGETDTLRAEIGTFVFP